MPTTGTKLGEIIPEEAPITVELAAVKVPPTGTAVIVNGLLLVHKGGIWEMVGTTGLIAVMLSVLVSGQLATEGVTTTV